MDISRIDENFAADKFYDDGDKTEGPGIACITENGGKTQINLFNNGLWHNLLEENSVFEVSDSHLSVVGGLIFGYTDDERFMKAIRIKKGNKTKIVNLNDCTVELKGQDALGRLFDKIIV